MHNTESNRGSTQNILETATNGTPALDSIRTRNHSANFRDLFFIRRYLDQSADYLGIQEQTGS